MLTFSGASANVLWGEREVLVLAGANIRSGGGGEGNIEPGKGEY